MKNGQSGAGMLDCNFSHVHTLAISEFRKDFPELAARLESMREKACGGRLPSEAAGAAAGVPELLTPPSNTGVNKTLSGALVVPEELRVLVVGCSGGWFETRLTLRKFGRARKNLESCGIVYFELLGSLV